MRLHRDDKAYRGRGGTSTIAIPVAGNHRSGLRLAASEETQSRRRTAPALASAALLLLTSICRPLGEIATGDVILICSTKHLPARS